MFKFKLIPYGQNPYRQNPYRQICYRQIPYRQIKSPMGEIPMGKMPIGKIPIIPRVISLPPAMHFQGQGQDLSQGHARIPTPAGSVSGSGSGKINFRVRGAALGPTGQAASSTGGVQIHHWNNSEKYQKSIDMVHRMSAPSTRDANGIDFERWGCDVCGVWDEGTVCTACAP